MASIHCPKCQGELSDSVATCPHCDHVVQPNKERFMRLLLNAYNIGCLVILAMLATAFVVWLLNVLR
jgi:predicted nucleic acid-binding Zn ribbon protein